MPATALFNVNDAKVEPSELAVRLSEWIPSTASTIRSGFKFKVGSFLSQQADPGIDGAATILEMANHSSKQWGGFNVG